MIISQIQIASNTIMEEMLKLSSNVNLKGEITPVEA